MKPPRIVLIGHVCIDANTSEHATYVGWGSSVLYMSQYYRLHTQAAPLVITSYGPDMLNYLPEVTLLPKRPNRQSTLRYENDSTRKKRAQRCFGAVASRPPAITAQIKAALQQADIVIVATLLPNYKAAYLKELLQYATPDSLKVLCPQGYFRQVAADGLVSPTVFKEAEVIIPLFDLVIYSEEDHPKALELARAWKQTFGSSVVVTQAARGAVIVKKDSAQHIPTTPIPPKDIVDSVGCGDTFAATVALEYYRTRDLPAAIRKAHQTAAAKLRAVITMKQP